MLAENEFLFYVDLPSYSHIATAIIKTTPRMILRMKMIYKIMW